MKLYTKYFALLLMLLTLTACPENLNEPDSEVIILNNSQNNIIYIEDFSLKNDTSLDNIPFPLTPQNTESTTISPNDSGRTGGPFLRFFKENPEDLFTLYLFDKDTIDQVPWEEIVERESKLRVTQYSLEQLEALDWTITYP